MLRIVSGSEMGVDRDDLEVRTRDELGQRELEIVVTKAEAIHAGVDLEMAAEPHSMSGGSRLQRPAGAGRRNCRRQAVFEDTVDVADPERAEDQDLGSH